MQEKEIKFGALTLSRENIKYYVLVGLLIFVGMWAWGYIDLLNSSGYNFAKEYLTSNQKVIDTLGQIKSSRPGFANFKRSYSAGLWTAKFSVVLEGDKISGVAFMKMKSADSGWQIEEATLKAEDQESIRL